MESDAGFDILYERGPCLVVLKPGGVLTQAPPGIDSLEARVRRYLQQRDAKPGRVYVGMVHRLDRPVSGAVAIGLHQRATRRIAEQFERRMVDKTYWAVVEGQVDPEPGTWTDTLRKIPDVARAELVPSDHPDARQAVLHYRVLSVSADQSWLEIRLETGRMHQIRLQAGSRRHPVLGDAMYGSGQPFGRATDDPRQQRIALHARRLSFRHPMTRDEVDVTAPLPADWDPLNLHEFDRSGKPDQPTNE